MKSYQTLLFDVDGTLLDFQAAQIAALQKTFQRYQIPFTLTLYEAYITINQQLWSAYENGLIDRDAAMQTRFSRLFKQQGIKADGEQFANDYIEALGKEHTTINQAKEVVAALANHFDLYIVSNGLKKLQHIRLQDSGLYPYFKAIFLSEEIGYQKPSKACFQYVFEHIPMINLSQTLMIGDVIHVDILGGNQAGIDTCWYNPYHHPGLDHVNPTYEIETLTQLYKLINKGE